MLREDFSDLPRLRHWDFKANNVNLGTIKSLDSVRLGQLSSFRYRSQLNTCLAASHILSDVTLTQAEQIGTTFVTHADLECVDSQYLLCGLSDGGVAIYDTLSIKEGRVYAEVGSVKGGQRGSHKYQVDCVQWYPADTGLFTTSSRDKKVKIWDPNCMKPVDQFRLECHVLHHHMSPVATKHSLLSVGADTGEVILCDMRSGSSAHRLLGHIGPVNVIQWSPSNQYILASGGRDQTIKLWDVRAGRAHLMDLDIENRTETPHRKKRAKRTPVAHKNRVTSLCFTTDGLWLLSFSYDNDLRLWNSASGENMMVDYGETYTELKRPLRMSVTTNTYPDLVFIPSESKILVYEIFSGKMVNVLRGHFSTVLGAVYNPSSMDLYSFGTDRNFITWTPKRLLTSDLPEEEEEEEEEEDEEEVAEEEIVEEVAVEERGTERRRVRSTGGGVRRKTRGQVTQDTWSSDED